MPLPLNSLTLKRLALVKQLYQQAYLQSTARRSPVSRIIAIVTFDLATETMLKAVIMAIDSKKDVDSRFQALVDSTDNLLVSDGMSSLPNKDHIRLVHTIRNDAQHKAIYPSEDEVSDCRTYTSDFLKNITLQIWDKKFEDISLTELIQHVEIRRRLEKAEEYFKTNDFSSTIAYAKSAFDLCIDQVIYKVLGELPHTILLQSAPENSDKTIERMRRMVMLQTLGLNFAEYIKYTQSTSSIMIADFGNDIGSAITGPEPDEKDAKYTLEYVIDVIAQIENYVGDIEKPFGLEYV